MSAISSQWLAAGATALVLAALAAGSVHWLDISHQLGLILTALVAVPAAIAAAIICSGRRTAPLKRLAERIGLGDESGRELDARALAERLERRLRHAESADDRWHLALEGPADALWDWNLAADRVYYSPNWKSMLGLAEDEVGEGLDEWISRVHRRDLRTLREALQAHRHGETPTYSCEYRMRTKDGTWRWFQDRGRIIERDADGKGVRIVALHSDITERRRAESSLSYLVGLESVLAETSHALLAAQPEAIPQVIDRILGTVAKRMGLERMRVFRLDPESDALICAHDWSALDTETEQQQAPRLSTETLPRWMETLRHGDEIRIADIDALPVAWDLDRAALERLGMRAAAAVPLRADGLLGGFVTAETQSAGRDWRETELRSLHFLGDMIAAALERRRLELDLAELHQRVEEVAFYDPLTGLPNRHLLAERMRESMAAAQEAGTQLAVCYLDLDGFKQVNERYGNEIGDRVLVAVAGRLLGQIRESDTVARLGGDELVLLLGGFDSLIECAKSVERLIHRLGQPIVLDDMEIGITASVGVTLYPRDANDADTLLRHADYAMFQAKRRGRNRCRFFDTQRDRRALARRSKLQRIGDAIEGDELRLYFQPKVDMRRGRVIGAEALLRWQHPEQGLLLPGAFLPLVEGSELIQRLDWWVLERGLDQLETWQTRGLDLELSINVSASSMQCDGFARELDARLGARESLQASSLSLEILESEALGDLDAVADVIQRCQALGVRFALDDFGTGYSSLTYFRRLPAQVLKIDQTFVRDMLRSRDDRHIVEGVIGLANAFEREVIAEGVESAAHGLMLLRMGCDLAQGFGIGEPMPEDRLRDWLRHYATPGLWDIDPDLAPGLAPGLDWSGDTLDLLGMESAIRTWVANLLQSAASDAPRSGPELRIEHCPFERWYRGPGQLRYGELDQFRALDIHHQTLYALARKLIRAQDSGEPIAEPLSQLLDARDQLILGLHRLQERVLGDG